jgi:single-strand DNA-binding protein
METSRQNLVVLRGVLTAEPQERTLPTGAVAVQFDVRTTLGGEGDGAVATVPVSWIDPPPADRASLEVGEGLVVIGAVCRRFFRAGGATQSRTEVVAEVVVPRRRTRSVRSAIARAVDSLGE